MLAIAYAFAWLMLVGYCPEDRAPPSGAFQKSFLSSLVRLWLFIKTTASTTTLCFMRHIVLDSSVWQRSSRKSDRKSIPGDPKIGSSDYKFIYSLASHRLSCPVLQQRNSRTLSEQVILRNPGVSHIDF